MPKISNLPSFESADFGTSDLFAVVLTSLDETQKVTIQELYESYFGEFLRLDNNISSTNQVVKNGAGSSSILGIGNAEAYINGPLSIGKSTAPGAVADIASSGQTSGTSSLKVTQGGNRSLLNLKDDGTGSFGDPNLNVVFDFWPQSRFNQQCYFVSIGSLNSAQTYLPMRDYDTGQDIARLYQNTDRKLSLSDNNTFTGSAVALLELNSTSRGLLFPRMTTAQKNAITAVAGLVVYDTTLNKLCMYNGAAWETITSV